MDALGISIAATLGAVLGAVGMGFIQGVARAAGDGAARESAPRLIRGYLNWQGRRTARLERKRIGPNLVAFFESDGRGPMFRTQNLGSKPTSLPIVVNDRFDRSFVVADEQNPLLGVDSNFTRLDSSRWRIARRRLRGVRLFDDPILCVEQFSQTSEPLIRATQCNYFAYATVLDRLEAVGRSRLVYRRNRLLGDHFGSASVVVENPIQPLALSCSVVTVFRRHDAYVVPLHRRSPRTNNGAGQLSVVPTFGMSAHRIGTNQSQHDPIFWNFAREYGEEFFGLDDAVEAQLEVRGDPDWIFREPEISGVRAAYESGKLRLSVTGVAFVPRDVSVTVALLAEFVDSDFSDVVGRIDMNWEGPEQTLVQVEELASLIANEEVIGPSLFALDRAMPRLMELITQGSDGDELVE